MNETISSEIENVPIYTFSKKNEFKNLIAIS